MSTVSEPVFNEPASSKFPWTEVEIARLIELAPTMLRAELAVVMNAEFGTNRTVNSIIGKCNKLGIKSGPTPEELEERERKIEARREEIERRKEERHQLARIRAADRERKRLEQIKLRPSHTSKIREAAEKYNREQLEKSFRVITGNPFGGTGLGFVSLEKKQCKYPLGGPTDPADMFCGDVVEGDRCYCPAHHKLCYGK
jgi:hypothetical protein